MLATIGVAVPDDECGLVEGRKRGFVGKDEVDELHECPPADDVRAGALSFAVVFHEPRVVYRLQQLWTRSKLAQSSAQSYYELCFWSRYFIVTTSNGATERRVNWRLKNVSDWWTTTRLLLLLLSWLFLLGCQYQCKWLTGKSRTDRQTDGRKPHDGEYRAYA